MKRLYRRAALTARTVRHLSPAQITSYALQVARRRVMPTVGPRMATVLDGIATVTGRPLLAALAALGEALPQLLPLDAAARDRARALLSGRVRFLNIDADFGDTIDWRCDRHGRLWAYHLHYLDDLPAVTLLAAEGDDAAAFGLSRLLQAWREGNPVGVGAGWEPYPTSLRIVNLVRCVALLHAPSGLLLRRQLVAEIARQSAWLATCVEHHLRANHLLANLKALCLASVLLPEHPVLAPLLGYHTRLLRREVALQVLEDGGHYERSPMYHALVTGDLCELALVLGGSPRTASLQPTVAAAAVRATRFLETIRHPDGGLPYFNDTTGQESWAPSFLRRFGAARLAPGTPVAWPGDVVRLLPTGFVVMRAPARHLVFDCGPIGPDHQPGHAHADILSFELSAFGRRVLVNAGVRGYADDASRAWCRSTQAHNTVQIGEDDQVELWSAFRVGRRAAPTLIEAEVRGPTRVATGVYVWPHVGGAPRHARTVALLDDGDLVVADVVRGAGRRRVRSYLHLHPDVTVRRTGEREAELRLGHHTLALRTAGARMELGVAPYYPQMGVSQEGPLITLEATGDARIAVVLTSSARTCEAEHDCVAAGALRLPWPDAAIPNVPRFR